MKKILQIVIILLLFDSAAYSLVIHIAPITWYPEEKGTTINFQELLTRELEARFRWEKVSFKTLDSRAETPKSFMDAMRISTEYSLDYLLYGFVEAKESALSGELKLYDNSRQEVVQVFYAGDNRESVLRLAADLAGKIAEYCRTVLGVRLSVDKAALPSEGIISFTAGGGYWTPLTTAWAGYIQPLYSAYTALHFIPWKPAEGAGLRGFYLRTGLNFSFLHSINQAGYEPLHLFSCSLGIPASLCLDIGMRHTVSLGVEPQFGVDYLRKEQFNADVLEAPALYFACAANLEYTFH